MVSLENLLLYIPLAALLVSRLLTPLAGNTIATLASIVAAVLVYLALVLALLALSRDALALMPKGDKLARLLHIK